MWLKGKRVGVDAEKAVAACIGHSKLMLLAEKLDFIVEAL